MNKVLILQKALEIAKDELNHLKASAASTHAGAISSEAKQEGKYDTRALLDSYLAGAQSARVRDLESQIKVIERFSLKDHLPDEAIGLGTLAHLKSCADEAVIFALLLPCLGGFKVNIDNTMVQTIIKESPLGSALLGAFEGEEIHLQQGVYEIVRCF